MAETVRTLVLDANVLVAAGIAFVAGLVSFASPCVLPLVPGYLSYMTGMSGHDLAAAGARARGRVLAGSLLFVVGFAVPFAMLGFAVTSASNALNFLERNWLVQLGMGSLVVVLGLLMAGGRLTRELRISGRAPNGGLGSAPMLGFVFGVGWTPCIGPAAGAILTMSAGIAGGVSARGGVLGFVFALGLGLPFIVLGQLFRRMSGALGVLKRNALVLQRVGGGLLTVVGLAIATGLWSELMLRARPLIQGFETPL